jgi:hypothetical protein
MNRIEKVVEEVGAGRDSYVLIFDYSSVKCIEVIRVLEWDKQKITKFRCELRQCTTDPVRKIKMVQEAVRYNKGDYDNVA